MPQLQVGDSFPTNIPVFETTPNNKVDLGTLLPGKKVIIFGVPGAFTPTCSNSHLPSYIKEYETLKTKGVDEIICLSVNDAFVMDAWSKSTGSAGKIRLLADPQAELAKASGLGFDAAALGGTRFNRFSALVENGKVTQLNVEESPGAVECTLAKHLKL